jgi:hypothetical protein
MMVISPRYGSVSMLPIKDLGGRCRIWADRFILNPSRDIHRDAAKVPAYFSAVRSQFHCPLEELSRTIKVTTNGRFNTGRVGQPRVLWVAVSRFATHSGQGIQYRSWLIIMLIHPKAGLKQATPHEEPTILFIGWVSNLSEMR